MQKVRKSAICLLMSMLCMLFVFSLAAPIDFSAASGKSITLECKKDDVILKGMRWKIFRAGERNGEGFVLTGEFADCQADLGDMSVENISHAAQTLESHAISKKLGALQEGYTGTRGDVVFSGLSDGLYLAVGYPLQEGAYFYEPSPLLMEVRGDELSTTFDAYPKIVRMTLGDSATAYTVRKVWIDDDDAYKARPTYVTVDIFKNEELYDTITLDESNEWQYRWVDLDNSLQWRVAEREVPTDYEVRIDHTETQFLIKNSYKVVTETTTTAATTVTTTTTTAVTTGGSSATTTAPRTTVPPTSTTTTTTKEKIPQTGQLWWPVLPMGVGGLMFIGLGISIKPRKKND
ncbi:MAG: Cna B-type domain-containing protein [Ruminococcus sp.]|uniref:Cna B-type domain-containing protein n=1 Tax=Ruminococcus sp. TaxID=41978 RepID=UPI0025D47C97|nr:Cna B-type domain-containing protein [Ruminococcus sp.]MBR6995261.1 Cna B-type domain-containing protein [Ruminococcus sp.]